MRVHRLVFTLIAASVSTESLSAQAGGLSIGGGVVIPASQYSSHDHAGWHVLIGYTPVGSPSSSLALRVDGLFGQTTRKTGFTGSVPSSKVFGLGLNLELHTNARAAVMPYLLAGTGYYELEEGNLNGTTASPESGIAVIGGLGLAVRLGGARGFVEGRLIAGPGSNGISFVPVTVGVSIGGW